MARPYADEMAKIGATFSWASKTDIRALRRAIKNGAQSPLVAIGSGGSLTAAHALAALHRKWTQQLSYVATPLEAVAEPVDVGVVPWLLSAGGGNIDIKTAFKALVTREPRQLVVLCGKSKSRLAELAAAHPFVDQLIHESPAGKDGFLATNSLLAFTSILSRAYAEEFDATEKEWSAAIKSLNSIFAAQFQDSLVRELKAIWKYETVIVLYGLSTKIGAIDLESKFTEAALGNLQIADFRNFGHGRHHWLAKRGKSSAIIAIVSERDRSIAERTLRIIPKSIRRVTVELPGSDIAASIGSLVAAFTITGAAGLARGIDPGRPGVPQFGRELYSLAAPRPQKVSSKGITEFEGTAIQRKSGVPISELRNRGDLDYWCGALAKFSSELAEARFSSIVLDYDGTVVDTRDRYENPRKEIIAQLGRLLDANIQIAIATGRGKSVKKSLRETIAPENWKDILIGYYNGAEILELSDERLPDGTDSVCEELQPIAKLLSEHPELMSIAKQTNRKFQITLETNRPVQERRLWEIAHQAILLSGMKVSITRSSHSVDIIAPGVSKNSVFNKAKRHAGASPLAIGDRGRWPGNDFELLRNANSLSVDEVSSDPSTCWNLVSPGQRGMTGTLEYLKALVVRDGFAQFEKSFLR